MAELAEEIRRQESSRFRSIIMGISKGMVIISCVMLTAMLVISTADVAGRYFFSHPIEGTFELVSMAFVVCGAFAIGYTQLIKGHININIVSDRLKRRPRAGLYLFSHLVSLAACAMVGWQGWLRMTDYFHKTVGGQTVTIGLPIWPFMLIFSLGFFWVAFIFIIDIYDSIVEVMKP